MQTHNKKQRKNLHYLTFSLPQNSSSCIRCVSPKKVVFQRSHPVVVKDESKISCFGIFYFLKALYQANGAIISQAILIGSRQTGTDLRTWHWSQCHQYKNNFFRDRVLFDNRFPRLITRCEGYNHWFSDSRRPSGWRRLGLSSAHIVAYLIIKVARDSFESNRMCQFFLSNLLFMAQAFRKWNIRGSPCSIFQKIGPNIAIFNLVKGKLHSKIISSDMKDFFP